MEKYIVKDDGLFVTSSNIEIHGADKNDELYFYSDDKEKVRELFDMNIFYKNYLLLKDKKENIYVFGYCDSDNIDDYFQIIDEPQFKQGDKVLYTDDLVNWEEGIYLVKHNESYIVESDEMLLYAIHIKPYEDEIKVGDWVVNTHHGSVFKNDTINLGVNQPNRYKKITNPQLIELLNNEL